MFQNFLRQTEAFNQTLKNSKIFQQIAAKEPEVEEVNWIGVCETVQN